MFMKRETKKPLNEQRRIVAYLDGLPPIGDASRQAKVNALHLPRRFMSGCPALRYGDGSQSASEAPEGVLRDGVVNSSALRASSPKGEDSALGVFCTKALLADIKRLVQKPPL
jgi:hypothetical protein